MPGRVLAVLLLIVMSAAGLTVWIAYSVANGLGLNAAWPVVGLAVTLCLALGVRMLTRRMSRDDSN